MKNDRAIQVGEQFFQYRIGNTLIGVWEVERPERGRLRAKPSGASFTVPYSDEWLNRTQVAKLILRKLQTDKPKGESDE